MKKILLIILVALFSCGKPAVNKLSSPQIKIEYNALLHSKIINPLDDSQIMTDFSPSEYIISGKDTIRDFIFENSEYFETDSSKFLKINGLYKSENYNIKKTIKAEIFNEFPEFIFTKVSYQNLSSQDLLIGEWVNQNYFMNSNGKTDIPFWSYQSGSYGERPDWVLPLKEGFYQKNYMGMNASDYGGGTPVIDVWRNDIGLALGHVELKPKLVSLPVDMKSKSKVEIRLQQEKEMIIKSLDTFETYMSFVTIHKGDYFHTLSQYNKIMQKRGIRFRPIPDESYEPIWCAWGYERNFYVEEVLETLPKVKELGFKWAVLDDGWQTAEGDWYLNPEKFPKGDSDMVAFVDRIHKIGLKAKLWWAPLAVDPGTDLEKNHSDMILINKEGKPQNITWWDSYYLCPAYEPTLDYTKKLVEKIIGEWGFDGLKIDGQHLNGAPPCYNPAHHHAYPEESVEAMPNFFKTIYEKALSIKPNCVIEICPCGTAYSYYMLPYLNQPVSSDPTSSWQIRLKGKTFKALMGEQAPYYGDHVELSDNKNDFASTVGVGGIVGTKFTWPVGIHLNSESGDVSLTPPKENEWKKWVEIYTGNMLSKGNYLGELYDIGFDRPEIHAVEKDSVMYYAVYADKFDGNLELRGLDKNSKYEIIDYVNHKIIGKIQGNDTLKVEFIKYLLLKAQKQNSSE